MGLHLRGGRDRLLRTGVGGSLALAGALRECASFHDEHGLSAEDALIEAGPENGIPWTEERHLNSYYTSSVSESYAGGRA